MGKFIDSVIAILIDSTKLLEVDYVRVIVRQTVTDRLEAASLCRGPAISLFLEVSPSHRPFNVVSQ